MKNLLYLIIGIIIGATIVYLVTRTSESSNEFQLEKLSQEEISTVKFLASDSIIDPDLGGPIPVDRANRQLKAMRKWRKWLVNRRKVVISAGYSFGLNSLTDFIDSINYINNNNLHPDPNDSITGVRAHLSLVDTVDQNNKRRKFLDVFLVPVLYSGKNFIAVDEKFNPDSIPLTNDPPILLNTSNPCPDYCD